MVVLSLAAMRERDLFGSFEPQHLTGCIYIAMWGISQVDVTYPPHGMHLNWVFFFTINSTNSDEEYQGDDDEKDDDDDDDVHPSPIKLESSVALTRTSVT